MLQHVIVSMYIYGLNLQIFNRKRTLFDQLRCTKFWVTSHVIERNEKSINGWELELINIHSEVRGANTLITLLREPWELNREGRCFCQRIVSIIFTTESSRLGLPVLKCVKILVASRKPELYPSTCTRPHKTLLNLIPCQNISLRY